MPLYNKAVVGRTISECEIAEGRSSVTIRFTDGWEFSVNISSQNKESLITLCYPGDEFMAAYEKRPPE